MWTPGGAGTHTGHTGHTGARGHTDHTDEPHNHYRTGSGRGLGRCTGRGWQPSLAAWRDTGGGEPRDTQDTGGSRDTRTGHTGAHRHTDDTSFDRTIGPDPKGGEWSTIFHVIRTQVLCYIRSVWGNEFEYTIVSQQSTGSHRRRHVVLMSGGAGTHTGHTGHTGARGEPGHTRDTHGTHISGGCASCREGK